jgi:3-hydroxyacyl-[acyl-carrier-protein] dehydratase
VFRTLNVKPDEKAVYYYAGIDNARFKRPVEPGDQLAVEVLILGSKRGIWKFGCRRDVGERWSAEADILCTVRPVGSEAK